MQSNKMYNDPFIKKIIYFYNNNKLLSYLLLLNLILFILFREKFYISFFFLYLLYFSGNLFIKLINNLHLILTFILGAVVGGALFMFWQKTTFKIPDNEMFSAALQSAILCTLTAITAYTPNHLFRIFTASLKLKYITIVLIIVNLLSVNVPALYLAHLGSVAVGLLYGGILYNTHRRKWRSFFSFFSFFTTRKPKMRAEYNPSRPLSDDDYNAIKAEKQKKMDAILDKISKSGYDSLSKEEKDFLFSSSKS